MPFRHGKMAFGARFVRDGFAFTPEHDLEFALGYPHVITLVEAPTNEAMFESYASVREVPREQAPRFARWLATGKVPAATYGDTFMSEDEARDIVAARMKASLFERDRDLVRLLEAIVGPEIVLDAITSGLEAYGEAELGQYNRAASQTTLWLSLGLLRARTNVSEEHRKRLEALFERWPACQMRNVLDMTLHGGAGVKRCGYKYEGFIQDFDLIHAYDDPKLVTREIKKGVLGPSFVPDARLAFIGGEPLIDFYAKSWPKIRNRADLHRTLDAFGRMRSKSVKRMMREVSERSSAAKERATAWLDEH
jgi:hypothetical protein